MLGSGSGGNSTLVAHRSQGVLIDAGLSYRQIARRLNQIGFNPDLVGAIVITHAHGDHMRGARMFSRRHNVPVYATETIRVDWGKNDIAMWRDLWTNKNQNICGLTFYPMKISHDASETLAFRIDTLEGAIGFATDIGVITPELVDHFRGCRVVIVESNHATELLRVSPYDQVTRARIGSDHGHLSNEALAEFIRTDLGLSVRCLILVHLSQVNNLPELAEISCREALAEAGRTDVEVIVAQQNVHSSTVDLASWLPRGTDVSQVQSSLPFQVDLSEYPEHQS